MAILLETPHHGPHRVAPILFLIAFAGGFAINYAIPWFTLGGDGVPTTNAWASDLNTNDPIRQSIGPLDPSAWVLAGLIVGCCLSILWLIAAMAVPARVLTRKREAGVAALLAIPLYLVTIGGTTGLGMAFQLNAASDRTWAVSIDGIVVTALALAGILALGVFLLHRITERRLAPATLLGALVATALFQTIPWATTIPGNGGRVTNTWRVTLEAFARFGTDGLTVMGLALLLLVIGATVWVLAVTMPPPAPRYEPLVDGAFALLGLAPVMLALVAVGRFLGPSMASIFTTGQGVAVTIAGYVFLALDIALAAAFFVTVRRGIGHGTPEASA